MYLCTWECQAAKLALNQARIAISDRNILSSACVLNRMLKCSSRLKWAYFKFVAHNATFISGTLSSRQATLYVPYKKVYLVIHNTVSVCTFILLTYFLLLFLSSRFPVLTTTCPNTFSIATTRALSTFWTHIVRAHFTSTAATALSSPERI